MNTGSKIPKRFSGRPILFLSAVITGLWIVICPVQASAQTARDRVHRFFLSHLRVEIDLASEPAASNDSARNAALDDVATEMYWASVEQLVAKDLFSAQYFRKFDSIVTARSELPVHYLLAVYQSYGRLRAAAEARQHDWVSKHLTAAKKYAALAARSLVAKAQINENHAAKLVAERFAVRRSPERTVVFLEELRRNGLSPEHRKLLMEGGYQEGMLDAYLQKILATPPGELGFSIVELYTSIAKFRRALASDLEEFARSDVAAFGQETRSQTFVVDNPHDRAETVDLYIRRVSIPEGWRLAIVDVAEPGKRGTDAAKAKAQLLVREDTPGVRYQVHLPAKGQMRVASVVTPVGPLGENTTARWAVEGYIGNELIGGMMHEMHVPAILPDLKLPPIGATSSPFGGRAQWWLWAVVGAPLFVALCLLLLFVARIRKRRAASGSGAGG